MKFLCFLFLALALFSVGRSFVGADFTSASFKLENPINVQGGNQSSSSSFQYISTTSQLTQGQSTSISFGQNAGFLYFPDVVVTPPSSGGGGGGGGYTNVATPGLSIDCKVADFNCDKYVNIFDLSILLYYIKRPNLISPLHDLSEDAKIDFTDISILFYYWDEA